MCPDIYCEKSISINRTLTGVNMNKANAIKNIPSIDNCIDNTVFHCICLLKNVNLIYKNVPIINANKYQKPIYPLH